MNLWSVRIHTTDDDEQTEGYLDDPEGNTALSFSLQGDSPEHEMAIVQEVLHLINTGYQVRCNMQDGSLDI